jgi:hypothetical protein
MIEKPIPPNSAFHAVFANHFPEDAGKLSIQLRRFAVCPCGTHSDAQVCECKKKRGGETFSAHLRELVLAFGGGGDGGKMTTLFQCNYFTDRDSYFRGQVPSRDPHFHLFCLWCMPTASELGKQLKTCGLPIIYPPKATFKHLKSCCSSTHFPALKQNLIQRRCSFKSVIFYIRQNRKQNTYALKKTLLNNHTFQAGNDLAGSTLSTSSSIKFVLAAIVSSRGQSENYFIVPRSHLKAMPYETPLRFHKATSKGCIQYMYSTDVHSLCYPSPKL